MPSFNNITCVNTVVFRLPRPLSDAEGSKAVCVQMFKLHSDLVKPVFSPSANLVQCKQQCFRNNPNEQLAAINQAWMLCSVLLN